MHSRKLASKLAVAVVSVGCMVFAASAAADGGPSIAGAPSVTYGVQSFGNTTTYPPDTNGVYSSYWLLHVLAGDHVTIDWQGVPPDGFGVDALLLYPVGTNDYNVGSTNWVDESDIGSNGSAQLHYTAKRTGEMPLRFYADESGEAGPYNFTAYVAHSFVAAIKQVSASHRHHFTSFAVKLHNPDGALLNPGGVHTKVQVRVGGRWKTVEKVAGLAFKLHWAPSQRGHAQRVRVRVSAPTYRSTNSRAITTPAF